MRPRVGHIQFLNCLPLYYGLVKNQVLSDIELIKGTPTELNQMLVARELDISPISSFQYGKHHRFLELLPGITVSSDGEVKSIFLISKVHIEKLDRKKIALTNTSATSQNLLKIILQEKYNLKPEYFVCPPDLSNMLLEAEAALLIGDSALKAFYRKPEGLYFYDLGEEWKAMTGHKMVYAVWAVRKEYAQKYPQVVSKVISAFHKSMEYSVQNAASIAREIQKYEIYDVPFLQDYFETLEFRFDKYHLQGLAAYFQKIYNLGLISELPQIKFFEQPYNQDYRLCAK
ncbi:MAG: chorismate dehydratase [Clostridia bacterium]|jgi:chorismate dehydratase|nr:chorismate dehydratase [Clostridia bacterium]MDN5324235.1 chorismate dehydratase [Clostridia bacterium]